MKVEILNTGSELLLGRTLNTHGHWLGRELFSLGLRVERLVTVPDGDAIQAGISEAVNRCDVLLVTGGLGPTRDDITREAVAGVLGIELIEDEAALRSLEAYFEQRGRIMAPENRRQAQVPVGADVLPNPNGTAPGLYIPPRLNGAANCAVFLLPGPPRELHPMFEAEVVPRLRALGGIEDATEILELKFTGLGESELHREIDAQLEAIDGLEVGYCARPAEVDLRLIGPAAAVEAARKLALERLGDRCFSQDGSSMEAVVVRAMARRGLKLALAESCTGGLIASRVTDVPGASAVLTHGFVTYANEAKVAVLGVSEADLAEHGAVSETVARQMAEGALRVSGADLAAAVTGIAGPDGGSDEKPVGTVFIAVAMKGGETRVEHQFHRRDRAGFKLAVSQAALEMVRRVAVAQSSALRADASGCAVRPPVRDLSPIVFVPFRKDSPETIKKRRRLPHWRQEGATYFVTFRTADSLPKDTLDRWYLRRAEWLGNHGIPVERNRPVDLSKLSFEAHREYDRTFVKALQTELDRGLGDCPLADRGNAVLVERALRHFDGERYRLGDFVIMPNHVHLLVQPGVGHELSEILKSWKGFTAREINGRMGRTGNFWQKESWDHIVRTRRQLDRFREYIADNPRMARLPEGVGRFSAAEWGD
ncbi:competence/damage-inducible protein A [Haloferula sp. A504]|uniref:competence/damage-inducible protein A n=1 Tax=Haloferula sp. A504 TaxID=3373601 RepID=UPI0031C56462|nr:competence/damage-inducible protein A [Verrucomicrobiaceae bacterium E54]